MKRAAFILALLLNFITSPYAETLHKREDTSHSGTRDGLSYETAWGSWSAVQYGEGSGKVSAGDTLCVHGANSVTSDINLGNIGAPASTPYYIDGNCPEEAGSITLNNSGTNITVPYGYPIFRNVDITASNTASSILYIYSNAVGVGYTYGTMDGSDSATTGILVDPNMVLNEIVLDHATIKNLSGAAAIRWLESTGNTGMLGDLIIWDSTIQDISGQGVEARATTGNSVAVLANVDIERTNFFNISEIAIWVINHKEIPGSGVHTWGPIKLVGLTIGNCGTGALVGGNSAPGWGYNIYADNTIYGTNMDSGGLNIVSGMYVDVYRNYIHDGVSSAGPNYIDGNGVLIDYDTLYARVHENRIDRMLGRAGVKNSGAAVMVLNAQNVEVWNNWGAGNKCGMYVGDVSSNAGGNIKNVKFYNNTFVDNIDYGLYFSYALDATDMAELELANNLLTGASSGWRVYNESATSGENILRTKNLFYGFAHSYGGNISSGENEIVADPMLTSSFTLRRGSPAINSGDATYCPATDMFGRPRLRCDIGASARGTWLMNGTLYRGTIN